MLKALFDKNQNLIYQFSRFAGIGFLNTAVDFSFLNLFIAVTGITAGGRLSVINAVAFSVAVFHSYYWNKFWAFGERREKVTKFLLQIALAGLVGVVVIAAAVFGAKQTYHWLYFVALIAVLVVLEIVLWLSFRLKVFLITGRQSGEFTKFMVVSVIGTFINSSVVGLVTGFIPPLFGTNPELWANLAKVAATAVALVWNFTGYKLLVFKK